MDTRSRQRATYAVIVATLVVVPTADLALGPDVAINGSYSVAALLAAVACSARFTAAVGAAAVAMSLLSGLWNDTTQDWVVRVLLSAALAGIAVVLARIRVHREQELQHMTAIAETAQRALLRSAPERVGSVAFAGRYVSATRDARVGGDLYDVTASPYGVRVLVGDVRGKGLDGVQLAGTVLRAFRRAAPLQASLVEVAARLDAVVSAVAGDEDFVTAVLVELREDDTITVVNCGHPPPVLVDRHGAGTLLAGEPTPPLGIGPEPHADTFPWPADARLLLYTDGLIEARDGDGRFLPLEEHLATIADHPLEESLDDMVAALEAHSGGQIQDDVAMILADHARSA